MTCQGCEARREWIKKHARQAKERMQRVLMSLGVGAKQSVDSIDQSDGADQQRTDSTDQ
ncbi:hypothetical protein [Acinetobacter sp. ACNIH2]|uniref:hypothetical protein n=1 Tax=Acinetobacter sp. ACNIH2 TaxID=1758189 RepID=UPI0013159929|nr:hypothetical protein [Acinetobacter sp. ACNIH2]